VPDDEAPRRPKRVWLAVLLLAGSVILLVVVVRRRRRARQRVERSTPDAAVTLLESFAAAADSLARDQQAAADEAYLDTDRATARFGEGAHGARPPSGSDRLIPAYRSGVGAAGQVAYLDVWERNIPVTEDPNIEAVALGAVDTSSRCP
jgi:hypothetical protein